MEKLLNEGEFPSNPLIITDIQQGFKDKAVTKIIEIDKDTPIDDI